MALKNIPATYQFTLTHDYITMPDTVQLAVDYYTPIPKASNPNEKFPMVVEFLPYRKDDSFATRDYPLYSYFAKRGILGVRIDIRGTGSSQGVCPTREYSDQELQDIIDGIQILSANSTCNGNVGMLGKSWSAINGIATAIQAGNESILPQLKTLIFVHSASDLFAMDVHGWDGGIHLDVFSLEIDVENILPAQFLPGVVGNYVIDANYFANRFNTTPWIFEYLNNQRDGSFWITNRSLLAYYDKVKIPIYGIGGFCDGYKDAIVDMAENMPQIKLKTEMGTQNHSWPYNGTPGPMYENRQTATRWFQHWLNNVDTGIMRGTTKYSFHERLRRTR